MKGWLDNITDEQITSFIRHKNKFDEISIIRKNDTIKVTLTQIYCDEEYEDKEFTYYFNAFGEGYVHLNKLHLLAFNNETNAWFNMVNQSNLNKKINGVTYCEAFEQAHEKAMLENTHLKNTMLQKKVNEQKILNDMQLKKDLTFLHNCIHAQQHGPETNTSLIVSSILNHMNTQEKSKQTNSNEYTVTCEMFERNSVVLVK